MDKKINDRGWVKSAIIVFLTIMLVLTFFSNTIMNYSLPEVSAQYTKNGTINRKVTGSGIVEAADTYEVRAESSREIKGVAVKVGDSVVEGQTLFTLSGSDSNEYLAAQKAYDDANLAYQRALLEADGGGNYTQELMSIEQLEKELEEAKLKKQQADEKYKAFMYEIQDSAPLYEGVYGRKVSEAEDILKQLEGTRELYLTAKQNYAKIQAGINTIQAQANVKHKKYKELETARGIIETEKNTAISKAESVEARIGNLEREIARYNDNKTVNVSTTVSPDTDKLKAEYFAVVTKVTELSDKISQLEKQLPAYETAVSDKEEQVYAAKTPILEAEGKKNGAQSEYDIASEAYTDAKEVYESIKSKIPKLSEELEAEIKTAQRKIDSLYLDLKYLKQTINNDSSDTYLATLNEAYADAYAEYKIARNALAQGEEEGVDEDTMRHLREKAAFAGEKYRAALASYEAALTDESRKSNAYDKELAAKEMEIRIAEEDIDVLKKQLKEALKSEVVLKEAQKIADARSAVLDEKRAALSQAKAEYNKILPAYKSLETELNSLKSQLENKKNELESTKTAHENAKKELDNKRSEYLDTLNTAEKTPVAIELLTNELGELMAQLSSLNAVIARCETKLAETEPALLAAKIEYDESNSILESEKSLMEVENVVIDEYDTKKERYNTLINEVETQKTSLADGVVSARSAVYAAEKALQSEKYALETKRAEDIKDGKLKSLELASQKRELDNLKQELDEKKADSQGTEIVSKFSGIVSAINISAGEETMPSQSLATIQLVERGFKVSFGCTAEQARSLKVGDVAELRNIWSYGTEAVLESIKSDPSNPGKMKILTFDITGDVSPGQNLNISVGSKSQSYEFVVPNTAIREDSKGKYILSVVSKQSPLGNRYIATRLDVEVLASDDTTSAINGVLHGNEFVITGSSKPISPGEQVKLAEEG